MPARMMRRLMTRNAWRNSLARPALTCAVTPCGRLRSPGASGSESRTGGLKAVSGSGAGRGELSTSNSASLPPRWVFVARSRILQGSRRAKEAALFRRKRRGGESGRTRRIRYRLLRQEGRTSNGQSGWRQARPTPRRTWVLRIRGSRNLDACASFSHAGSADNQQKARPRQPAA